MLSWIRKRLGYHVCENWTPWEAKKADCARVPRDMNEKVVAGMVDRIEYTKRWQERKCTECGWTDQRDMDY